MMKYIKMDKLDNGGVYSLHSRNLNLGVWDKTNKGFIGIRTKFESRYLFTEYHWDCESFATAKPLEKLAQIPSDIPITERLFTFCEKCGVKVEWVHETSYWKHLKENECNDIRPVRQNNKQLFTFLDNVKTTS